MIAERARGFARTSASLGLMRAIDFSRCGFSGANGARLVVISFHSLEDRIVKTFIARESRSVIDRRAPFAPEKPHRLKSIARMIAELDKARTEERLLDSEFERLKAEKQSQATPLRVEKAARDKLAMRTATPAVTQYVTYARAASAASPGAR